MRQVVYVVFNKCSWSLVSWLAAKQKESISSAASALCRALRNIYLFLYRIQSGRGNTSLSDKSTNWSKITHSHCFSQISSCPPERGSVLSQTWPHDPVWRTPSPGARVRGKKTVSSHFRMRSRVGCKVSSDWRRYLRSDGSAPQTLLIQILLRACRNKFRFKTRLVAQISTNWREMTQ